jgi:hypothetical protein
MALLKLRGTPLSDNWQRPENGTARINSRKQAEKQ